MINLSAMQFNISRQPLIPAFLTLAALTVAAVSGMDAPQGVATNLAVTGSTLLCEATANLATTAAQPLAIDLPHTLLAEFQATYPCWSKLIAGLLILFAGMCTGHMTVRYNLYTVSTCLAIPLYAIIACGLPAGNNYLNAFVASALLALALKNYAAAFCNGYGFDAIFRASIYLGLLVFVLPASLPLLLLLPLSVLLFRRTLREAVVALFGLLLPAALLCYANWGFGGDFTTPITAMGSVFITGTPLALFFHPQPLIFGLLSTLILLTVFATVLFLSDRYNAGTKARLILIFNIGILILTAAQLCGPAATTSLFALLAIPLAVLLPILFVRIQHTITMPLYLLLLIAAFYGAIIQ